MASRFATFVLIGVCAVFVSVLDSSAAFAQKGCHNGATSLSNCQPELKRSLKPVNFLGYDNEDEYGKTETLHLFGPPEVQNYSTVQLGNMHSEPVFVTLCYNDGSREPTFVGIVSSLDMIEFEIEDDPRSGGHEVVVKVETREYVASLLVGIY